MQGTEHEGVVQNAPNTTTEKPKHQKTKKSNKPAMGGTDQKRKQVTADRVISRIMWDEQAKSLIHLFTVGYLDRFVGIVEKNFRQFDFTVDIASVDMSEVFTIPEHRIQYFKLGKTIVWDKREGQRIDLVFGSLGGSTLSDTITNLGFAAGGADGAAGDQDLEETRGNQPPPNEYSANHPHLARLTRTFARPHQPIPTHYFHIPVLHPNIISGIKAVGESMCAFNPALSELITHTHRLHVSLCPVILETQEQARTACHVLRECCTEFEQVLREFGSEVSVEGVRSFGNRVVYAAIQSDAILRINSIIRLRLTEAGIRLAPNRIPDDPPRSQPTPNPTDLDDGEDDDYYDDDDCLDNYDDDDDAADDDDDAADSDYDVYTDHKKATAAAAAAAAAAATASTAATVADDDYLPHITIAKLNSLSMSRHAGAINTIDPRAWESHYHRNFGKFVLSQVQLCEMPWWNAPTNIARVRETIELNVARASKPACVAVFDFDGTLLKPIIPNRALWTTQALDIIRRPMRKQGMGWFERPQFVSPPLTDAEQHMVPDLVAEAKRFMELAKNEQDDEPQTRFRFDDDDDDDDDNDALGSKPTNRVTTALVTARTDLCKDAIQKMLQQAGLHFDQLLFRPATVPSVRFKTEALTKLAKQAASRSLTGKVVLHVFDDDERVLYAALKTVAIPGKIDVAVHDPTMFPHSSDRLLPKAEELELVRSFAVECAARETHSLANEVVPLAPQACYRALVLNYEDQRRLLRVVEPPESWLVHADHVTLCFGEDLNKQSQLRDGEVVKFIVDAVAMSDRVLAVRVDLSDTPHVQSTNSVPHITIATHANARPNESNLLSNWIGVPETLELSGVVSTIFSLSRPPKSTNGSRRGRDNGKSDLGTVEQALSAHFGGAEQVAAQHKQRNRVLKDVETLVSGFSHELQADVGLWVVGSLALCKLAVGAHTDVDMVCISHTFESSAEFLSRLFQHLQTRPVGVWSASSRVVLDARVPRLALVHEPTSVCVDLCFYHAPSAAPATIFQHHTAIDEMQPEEEETELLLAATRAHALQSLEHTLELKLAFDSLPENIRNHVIPTLLSFVKAWAHSRALDSARMGYVPGVAWAVLVISACQRFAVAHEHAISCANSREHLGALCVAAVRFFFDTFSKWDWQHNHVSLFSSTDAGTTPHQPVADVMFVACPSKTNATNACVQVTPHTTRVIAHEFARAAHILAESTADVAAHLKKLLEAQTPPEFCNQSPCPLDHIVRVRVTTKTQESFTECCARIEARIPMIIKGLAELDVPCFPFGAAVARAAKLECAYLVGFSAKSQPDAPAKVKPVANKMQMSCESAICGFADATINVDVVKYGAQKA